MSKPSELQSLVAELVRAGRPAEELLGEFVVALRAVRETTSSTGETRVDLDRGRRCGHPEVIYGPGKSAPELVEIIGRISAAGQDVLATRVTPEQAGDVTTRFPEAEWNATARTLRLMAPADDRPETGRVLVLTAGTSDRPVAEEALETLAWMRVGRELITDIGVAGPLRLLEQLPRFAGADVVIVVAGMEGALPSVVGGWVKCPVIAAPTSVGYGTSLAGLTALLGRLNSCAANVAVVNIDAGFKAGYLAGLMAGRMHTEAG